MEKRHIQLIASAVSRVAPGYFKLATTYEPTGIVRERAFCYELYHMIRCQMSPDDPISLNGEIDKRGHIDFAEEDRKNPDFVFHVPGTHLGNTTVMEVKGTLGVAPAEIEDDILTLLTFVARYKYRGGVFLLYNHTLRELVNRLGTRLDAFRKKAAARNITVLAVKQAGQQPERALLAEL